MFWNTPFFWGGDALALAASHPRMMTSSPAPFVRSGSFGLFPGDQSPPAPRSQTQPGEATESQEDGCSPPVQVRATILYNDGIICTGCTRGVFLVLGDWVMDLFTYALRLPRYSG